MTSENTSNIDDLLIGSQGNSQQPPTPESMDDAKSLTETSGNYSDEYTDTKSDDLTDDSSESDNVSHETLDEDEDVADVADVAEDEYGNPKEILTKKVQKRLKRQADKYESKIQALESQIAQLTPQQHHQLQQDAKNISASSDEDWKLQFETMVEQTVYNMQNKKAHESRRAEFMRLEKEFEQKLFSGIEKFVDFRETIQNVGCDITDHMTNATRSLDDPAAFLYAASKRHPDELKRISQLRDPYAQVREMGKLEEKMRKNKAGTNAPRSLGKTREDANFPVTPDKKKNESIDDLLAKDAAKRLAKVRERTARR
jgi:hypothetical protein